MKVQRQGPLFDMKNGNFQVSCCLFLSALSQAALDFMFSEDLVQPKSGIVWKLGANNTKGEENTERKHIWNFANHHHDIYSKIIF